MANTSNDLVWLCTKKNSSFLVKRNGAKLSTEPGNPANLSSARYSGIANPKAVDIRGAGAEVVVTLKNPEEFNKPRTSNQVHTLKAADPRRVAKTVKALVKDSYYRPDVSRYAVARVGKLGAASLRANRMANNKLGVRYGRGRPPFDFNRDLKKGTKQALGGAVDEDDDIPDLAPGVSIIGQAHSSTNQHPHGRLMLTTWTDESVEASKVNCLNSYLYNYFSRTDRSSSRLFTSTVRTRERAQTLCGPKIRAVFSHLVSPCSFDSKPIHKSCDKMGKRSPSPAKHKVASSKDQSKHNARNADLLDGVTLDDSFRFKVPAPPNTLRALAYPSLPTIATVACFAFSTWAALPQNPSWYIVALCIFWRLGYDLGLGLILDYQSKTEFITTWVTAVQQAEGSVMHKFLSWLIDSTLGEGHNSLTNSKLPPAYSAWMVFRFLVNIILPNDVVAFCLVALRFTDWDAVLSFEVSDQCDWSQTICLSNFIVYPLCVVIGLCSIYAKISAHHVIGMYAWFWGDFFFKVEQDLTFDGIFELFPHPMYSVGYAWAYAVGLFTRSYVVLAVAMGSHMAQMIFLMLAETPHIEKLYGTESKGSDKKLPESNVLVIKNFDWFRSADISLCMLAAFMVTTSVFGSWDENSPLASDEFFVGQAIFWRSVASIGIGYVLIQQERNQFWTKHFEEQGLSKEEAFEQWKRLMNMLTVLQHIAFLLCSWRLFSMPPLEEVMSGFFAARVIFALLLWGLTYWAFSSSFELLGDFGWFYGDFFLEPPEYAQLTYTGIYRFINNPDVYIGHIWMYAVAIICSSWELFMVGVAAQVAHIIFLQLVEKPHLRALYSHKVRRHSTAVGKALSEAAGEILNIVSKSSPRQDPEDDDEDDEGEDEEEEDEEED